MKKGITPIISIIILLLITIGMAAAAWTYMGNYFSGLIGKSLDITSQRCVDGTDGMIIVKNIGTEDINVDSDIMVMQGSTVLGDADINWCEQADACASDTIDEIDAGSFAKAIIAGCTTTGNPKTCKYDFVISGRTQTAIISCSG